MKETVSNIITTAIGFIDEVFAKVIKNNGDEFAENTIKKVIKEETSEQPLCFKLDLQFFASKKDLEMVNDAAIEIGTDRNIFGEYIHETKQDLWYESKR